jgi:medium-chain acyl-[acyl-carrier-protein] hydrolase
VLSRKETFAVRSDEVDAFGTLAVPALSGYLQELAGVHAAELGVGLDALMARGLTWVLVRQRIECPAEIRLRETIEVETWPSGIDRLLALRDFVVRRGGEEVARATTEWLVLDVKTRKPVRPAEVLDERFREPLDHAVRLSARKLLPLASWQVEKRFEVRYADIDVNLHVTNASYVGWAIEAVPREAWQSSRLACAEVHFLAETRHGSAVLSRLARSGERAFSHAIVREGDEKELARVATSWIPR